ncbi:hypothetical protein [Corallococcus sp. 4LFB]|uniref:hypothetical protein n=1 Tax=Corallococcus sp. 4LFB TaxID=3383249 RepID=UPI0039750ED4
MRERHGSDFSPQLIDSFLKQQDIEVIGAPIDRTTAETWAELLNSRYTTTAAWKAAKLASVKAKLPDEAVLPASRIPMTTDWWIALAVEHDADAIIAVEDKGEEWRSLREKGRARSFNETLRWLEAQPDAGERDSAPGTLNLRLPNLSESLEFAQGLRPDASTTLPSDQHSFREGALTEERLDGAADEPDALRVLAGNR